MSDRDVLEAIVSNSADRDLTHLKSQLGTRHMIALADGFDGWSLDSRISPEWAASLTGFAEGLRQLAVRVGPT